MILHFVTICAIKFAQGLPGEILWVSHIALLIGGIGLLLSCPLLVAAALLNVLILHGLWLVDCGTWLATGSFPLGITTHLRDADMASWIATAHHFYLVPLLLCVARRRWVRSREALLTAVAVFLFLTALSRAFTDPALNVNFVFGARVGFPVPFFQWGNLQHASLYMVGLNAFVLVFMLMPAYLAARALPVTHREQRSADARGEATDKSHDYIGSSSDESLRCASIGSSSTCIT
jgi:hypothetical protein